jgi:hypothetical protein
MYMTLFLLSIWQAQLYREHKTFKKSIYFVALVNKLYGPNGRSLSAKIVPTFADRRVSRGQRIGSLRPYSKFLGLRNAFTVTNKYFT